MTSLALWLLLFAAPTNAFAPLTVYNGNWILNPGGEKLSNHCHASDAFYTCEQVLNGKAVAMLVFVALDKPGSYRSQVLLTNGKPGGSSNLTIDGSHWTFLTADDSGKPTLRVDNYFKDRDHIHFEQFKADASGAWTKTGEGDEVRVP